MRFFLEHLTYNDYITGYAYDGVNRVTRVTYPTGEVAIQTYNGRGLPYSLSSSGSGTIVSSMLYNNLALPTEMNLHSNNIKTTYGYWDMGGQYDNTGGYYGKLWKIKTVKDPAGTPITLQEVKHTWDAGGNLITRENVVDTETENFSYDNLDRLISAAGPYSESYAYNPIGNMTSKGGQSYTYGSSRPHAVTGVGSTNYIYDNNGNMTTRGAASLAWDAENRLTGISGTASVTYIYDGDGFRVKKTEGNTTILYINKYYEKNLLTGYIMSYYYFGDKMVAYKDSSDGFGLKYVHQDHPTGTSIVTNTTGTIFYSSIKYKPYGESRYISGSPPAQQFTGQRLDDVGLYYYRERYYDPGLGRFISADSLVAGKTASNSIVPALQVNLAISIFTIPRKAPSNPQSLNRYSYVLNNPLKYIDPNGHQEDDDNPPPDDSVPPPPINSTSPLDPQPAPPPTINIPNLGGNKSNNSNNSGQPNEGFWFNVSKFIEENGTYITYSMVIPMVGMAKITGFTREGINSAISHDGFGVNEKAMLDAVKNPLEVVPQSGYRTKWIGKDAVVVLNDWREVVTTWAKSIIGRRIP